MMSETDSARRSDMTRRLRDATATQLTALAVLFIGTLLVSTGMGFIKIPAASVV
jgi:hypothetical protein